MYLYENCDYWQSNGHTARHSHKFHTKCTMYNKYILKLVAPYLNHIHLHYYLYFQHRKLQF